MRINIDPFLRLAMAFAMLCPVITLAVDLQPNDIVAPLPDKTFVNVSYYDTQNSTFYKNGSAVTSTPFTNPVINNPNTILRLTRSYEISD